MSPMDEKKRKIEREMTKDDEGKATEWMFMPRILEVSPLQKFKEGFKFNFFSKSVDILQLVSKKRVIPYMAYGLDREANPGVDSPKGE